MMIGVDFGTREWKMGHSLLSQVKLRAIFFFDEWGTFCDDLHQFRGGRRRLEAFCAVWEAFARLWRRFGDIL